VVGASASSNDGPVDARPYRTLAAVYEWLLPDALATPEGNADAFADALGAGARVLDCAAGTGQLAVGLALRGFDVTASDASPAMVERTRALAARHGVDVPALVCRWDELGALEWGGAFDAVLCVGNSLAHAGPRDARRAALRAMAARLRPGGTLVLTSRNWEQVRAAGSRLAVGDALVERDGRRGLVVYGWTIADAWEDRHRLEIAVALLGPGDAVEPHVEALAFWPFRHEDLDEDLRATGLRPERSTYDPDVEGYLVTATA
jgi:SAM-dependent methyltransferase